MFGSKEHYAAWFGTGGLLLISISAWGFIFDGDYFGATCPAGQEHVPAEYTSDCNHVVRRL